MCGCAKVFAHCTVAAFTCPRSSRDTASSCWWSSMSVEFGTTMRGFWSRKTSSMVPEPAYESTKKMVVREQA